MKKLILICSLFIMASATSQNSIKEVLQKYNSGSVPYISAQELKMLQDENVLILDAREPEEYAVSHIRDAILIGSRDFDASVLNEVPKDRKLVVYCSLGVRSEKAAEKIQALGFEKVENLYGGIFLWKKSGYKVFDSEGRETEKVHTYSKKWSAWLEDGKKVY